MCLKTYGTVLTLFASVSLVAPTNSRYRVADVRFRAIRVTLAVWKMRAVLVGVLVCGTRFRFKIESWLLT